jgi:uncharacterized protein (TIGR03435 family)
MNLKMMGVTLAAAIGAVQAQTVVPALHPAFDVASIKRNTSGVGSESIGPILMGRFTANNIAVEHLMRLAYNVHDFEISGAPSWTRSEKFDIVARAEGMENATYEEMQPLLQSLLANRFKLLLHRETRDLPTYELVVAKGGSKLVAAKEGTCNSFDPKNPPPPQPGGALPRVCGATRMGRNLLQAIGLLLPDLAADLSEILGRPVADKTGLKGNFDIHLEFAPDNAIALAAQSSPNADLSGPSIFTALQEQLGLRLELSKGPIEVLIIDHVERPSEN